MGRTEQGEIPGKMLSDRSKRKNIGQDLLCNNIVILLPGFRPGCVDALVHHPTVADPGISFGGANHRIPSPFFPSPSPCLSLFFPSAFPSLCLSLFSPSSFPSPSPCLSLFFPSAFPSPSPCLSLFFSSLPPSLFPSFLPLPFLVSGGPGV
jgi:hypothetical protein